ncbi:unnamed protein product [Notodromas monacha]|uniref:Uncharacterized protein n=1 Tax=Notodromas monacha TaxID=399045 RepID=A0A7R9BL13_9CRUS|nr:unnamed protein product [Notodromas monacha]CAG0916077.1 unnamed protein product [Notodromas monacha]
MPEAVIVRHEFVPPLLPQMAAQEGSADMRRGVGLVTCQIKGHQGEETLGLVRDQCSSGIRVQTKQKIVFGKADLSSGRLSQWRHQISLSVAATCSWGCRCWRSGFSCEPDPYHSWQKYSASGSSSPFIIPITLTKLIFCINKQFITEGIYLQVQPESLVRSSGARGFEPQALLLRLYIYSTEAHRLQFRVRRVGEIGRLDGSKQDPPRRRLLQRWLLSVHSSNPTHGRRKKGGCRPQHSNVTVADILVHFPCRLYDPIQHQHEGECEGHEDHQLVVPPVAPFASQDAHEPPQHFTTGDHATTIATINALCA